MNWFIQVVSNVEFLKVALPAAAAIFAWLANERSKARSEQLQRKEERYKELIRCAKGFYVQTTDRTLKSQFIDQVGLCWLYAPDDVIQKVDAFFSTIHAQRSAPASDAEKEQALGELMLAIRKDMLSRRLVTRTRLSHRDWKNFSAT